MEDPTDSDHSEDRIGQAAERLRAASERASQAQELLTVAKERLAQARRALRESKASEPPKPATEDSATDET